MIHSMKVTLVFAVIALLSGCAGMNSKFGCPYKDIGGCRSMGEVNQSINTGQYAGGTYHPGKTDSGGVTVTQSPSGMGIPTPQPGQPVRFGETVQRVWIAPYEDKNDNYHEPAYVFTVLQHSHWIGMPVKAIQKDNG